MRLFLLGLLLGLSSCVPTFTPASPEQLTLTYDGNVLTLTSAQAFERGSIGIRATGRVTSPYCAVECLPDAEGRILLSLVKQDALYAAEVRLATVEGLVRVRAVVVLPGAREGLTAELSP